MAGPKININRYRLITLLYVIFVCLSVLNVPVSLLDSNYHLIKTLESQEKNRLLDIEFANRTIESQDISLYNDTARVYLNIQKQIHNSYRILDSVDKHILKRFALLNTSVDKEFASKRKIEGILVNDSLVTTMHRTLFRLVNFLEKQPYRLDNSIKLLVPVNEIIITKSSKKEIEWDRYLFLHKPTSISYMQIKRIKVLLLDNEFLYQNAALKTINFVPAYYSETSQKVILPDIRSTSDQSHNIIDSTNQVENKPEPSDADSAKPSKKELPRMKTAGYSKAQNETLQASNEYDNFFQQILSSLHAENLYVGIKNPLLKGFKYELNKDFLLDIFPGAQISRENQDVSVVFVNPGDYTLRFTDLRNSDKKIVFDKKVKVSILPNPIVKLSGDNNLKDLISVKDLYISNRLTAYLGLVDIGYFPGRITGYRITRITQGKEEFSVYNYGEVFQSQAQSLIKGLVKGDLILFDKVTLALQDGTTRSSNSIVYKIVD